MAEQEKRTPEQEAKQLDDARASVVTAMQEFTKSGSADEGKRKSFQESVARLENLMRLSIVREGGLDLSVVVDKSNALIQEMENCHKILVAEEMKLEHPKDRSSIDNLRALWHKVDSQEIGVMIARSDVEEGQKLGAEKMAQELLRNRGELPVDPNDLPATSSSKAK